MGIIDGVDPLTFRKLADDELRAAAIVFCQTCHFSPPTDEEWAYSARSYQRDRTFGAFDGDTLVGTAYAFDSSLTVPGGLALPMAAVTRVGVRTDHTRRGALSQLMRLQLESAVDNGMVFAGLRASETVIYGRFGYGIGTLANVVKVQRRQAVLRPEVPTGGVVRLLDVEAAMALLPPVYEAMRSDRPGLMGRPPPWWVLGYERRMRADGLLAAAHYDESGAIDGFLSYGTEPSRSGDPHAGAVLTALDFQAANQPAANDLWRFLLGVDLVDEIVVYVRPTDDPIDAMLVDLFMCRGEREDELWLRIVDVPAALAARTYAGDPVVIEVRDPLLANNSGRYLVSPQGTERTAAPAELVLDVDVLAMLYLGAWRASDLVGVGRLAAPDPSAPARADRLFAVDRPAWSGTLF